MTRMTFLLVAALGLAGCENYGGGYSSRDASGGYGSSSY